METAWTVISVVVPLLVGAMFAFLGLNPPEFRAARISLWGAALFLGGMDVVWQLSTDKPFLFRACVGLVIWGSIGAGVPEGLRWIANRQKRAEGAPTLPAPPSNRLSEGNGISDKVETKVKRARWIEAGLRFEVLDHAARKTSPYQLRMRLQTDRTIHPMVKLRVEFSNEIADADINPKYPDLQTIINSKSVEIGFSGEFRPQAVLSIQVKGMMPFKPTKAEWWGVEGDPSMAAKEETNPTPGPAATAGRRSEISGFSNVPIGEATNSDRHLTQVQTVQIKSALARFKASRIGIYTFADRAERTNYAHQIEEAFREAGWTPLRGQDLDADTIFATVRRKINHAGVLLMKHDQDNMPDLGPILTALEAARIPHRIIAVNVHELGIYKGDIDTSIPVIFIGSKTEPTPEQ